MWFKNLQVYRLPRPWAYSAEQLETALATLPLQSCPATGSQSIGWVPADPSEALVFSVNHQYLLALGIEQRLLPSSVVKQMANERAREIEEKQGRRVGRREMRELREALTLELLPRAFITRRTLFAWIDPVNGWLAIDAAATRAEELVEHLHKSIDGLPLALLNTQRSPLAAMTAWLAEGEAPAGFTIDQDLELRSAENATVRYAKHSLEGEEIREHIAGGKAVTRLALTWNDRVSFVLDDKLHIRRVEFLDILKEEAETQAENEDERMALDFTLMTGELARLLDDLVAALGGEAETGAA